MADTQDSQRDWPEKLLAFGQRWLQWFGCLALIDLSMHSEYLISNLLASFLFALFFKQRRNYRITWSGSWFVFTRQSSPNQ